MYALYHRIGGYLTAGLELEDGVSLEVTDLAPLDDRVGDEPADPDSTDPGTSGE